MKTNLIFMSLLLAGLFVAGCDRQQKDDYQFITSANGDCYVFHPKDGKVAVVTKDGIHSLDEATLILRVGEYYKVEDGSGDTPFLKYLGGGKFEPSKYAVKEVAD
jgi:hypothetical protein